MHERHPTSTVSAQSNIQQPKNVSSDLSYQEVSIIIFLIITVIMQCSLLKTLIT